MVKIICINEYGSEGDDIHFKVGVTYSAVDQREITYSWDDIEKVYIFYTDYDYDRDIWNQIEISDYHFCTPAEWRERQINEIINDDV